MFAWYPVANRGGYTHTLIPFVVYATLEGIEIPHFTDFISLDDLVPIRNDMLFYENHVNKATGKLADCVIPSSQSARTEGECVRQSHAVQHPPFTICLFCDSEGKYDGRAYDKVLICKVCANIDAMDARTAHQQS